MIKRKVTINHAEGLHARPASAIVRVASKFKSEFFVHMYGYRINGKSILGLMTLAADDGAELELETDGEDEQEAMDAILKLFDNGFELQENQ